MADAGSGALRLGTRGSALALAQSGHVAEQVSARLGRPVELVRVQTEGDVNAAAIAQIGGTGVFVPALRDGGHPALPAAVSIRAR